MAESGNEKINNTDNETLNSIEFDDAELSSLMDDIPENLLEELSGQMQAFSEDEVNQTDIINKLASSEDLMGESSHLDDLLSAALEQELSSNDSFDIGSLDTGFINDVSVYDIEEREVVDFVETETIPEEDIFFEEEEKPDNSFKALSGIIPIAVIGVLSLFIIVLGISFVMLLGRLPESPPPTPTAFERVVFTPPVAVPNHQNFIFLGLETEFRDRAVTLEKIVVDQTATVFYFDREFNILDTSFTLTDNIGRLYNLDLSFPSGDMTRASGGIVRFEPLIGRGSRFTLTMRDRMLDETAVFQFDLERLSDFTPARHINQPVRLTGTPGGVNITVENAIFSSAGSIVNFTFRWSDDIANVLINPLADGLPAISLRSPTRPVLPTRRAPALYHFPEFQVTLGRMDFGPVENLTSDMSINFSNLFEDIPIGGSIPTAGLFADNEEEWVHIPAGNHTAVLERMGRMGDNFVLVMHTLDGRGNRAESIPDATLMLTLRDGLTMPLEGSSRSGTIGTDVLFGIPHQFRSEVRTVFPGNISLNLRSLLVRLDDASGSLNLLEADDVLAENVEYAKTSVINSFTDRLRYKSSIIPLSQIRGFSEEVLNDEMLMRSYAPVHIGQYETAMFAAQIVSYAFIDSNTLICVVSETWKHERRAGTVEFNRTHQVVARRIGGNWVIVSDELVR